MHRFLVRVLLLALLSVVMPSIAQASEAPLQFAAPDTMAIVHLDLDRLRKSPLFKVLQTMAQKDSKAKRRLEEVKKELGFDPWKDVAGVTLFLGPTASENQRDVVAVLEGRYQEGRVLKFLEKQEEKAPEEWQGKGGKFYRFDRGRTNIAFRGKHILIGGPVERANTKHDPNAALATVRAPVEKSMLWLAVATNVAARGQLKMLGASELETLALGFDAPDGAKLDLRSHFSDPAAAAKLAAELRAAIDEASRDKTVQTLRLGEILKVLSVKNTGGDLDLSLSLTKAQASGLLEALQGLAR